MPYIKSISSRIARADNNSGGNKKAGLVSSTDWSRIPRNILFSNVTNTLPTLDCMLTNCRKVRDSNGVIQTISMPFTRTYVNKRARNNTLK
jgi:hypothetical protein